jgi:hypothetical protein
LPAGAEHLPTSPHSGSRATHRLLAHALTVNVPACAPGGPIRSASVRTGVTDVGTLLGKSDIIPVGVYCFLSIRCLWAEADDVPCEAEGRQHARGARPVGRRGRLSASRVGADRRHLAWLWGEPLGERRRQPGHFALLSPHPLSCQTVLCSGRTYPTEFVGTRFVAGRFLEIIWTQGMAVCFSRVEIEFRSLCFHVG